MNTGLKLDDIALSHKTDKSSDIHNFANFYDRRLSFMRNNNVKILEIGIGKKTAPSLHMWADYFHNGIIVGADILPVEKFTILCDNIEVYQLDQSSDEAVESFMSQHGPFDLIIDDGSHKSSHQIRTFNIGMNHLKSGGIIIIEDLHTSLVTHCNGWDVDTEVSALETIREASKKMRVDFFKGPTKNHDPDVSITSVIFPQEVINV